jgi:hypothetical protein
MERVSPDGKKLKINHCNLDMCMSRWSSEFIKSDSFSVMGTQATFRTTLLKAMQSMKKGSQSDFNFLTSIKFEVAPIKG